MSNPSAPLFATTRWSLVMAAGAGDSSRALEELCTQYWFPVYAVVRRSGQSPDAAQDLTQGFFHALLAGRWLDAADDSKGRFRTYLLTLLKRFLANKWHRENAAKRGGGRDHVAIDTALGERLYAQEGSMGSSADELFDRRWALAMLDAAMASLEQEYRLAGRESEFAALAPALTSGRGEMDYAALSATLGSSEGAIRISVHRLRKRFRVLIRQEVARTVGSDADIDEEMGALLAALGGDSSSAEKIR